MGRSAPRGNLNPLTHGGQTRLELHDWTGELAEVMQPVVAFRNAVEEVVARMCGSISIVQAALIQSSASHEGHARLAERWLNKLGQDATLDQTTTCLKLISAERDKRDGSLIRLNLTVEDRQHLTTIDYGRLAAAMEAAQDTTTPSSLTSPVPSSPALASPTPFSTALAS